MHNSPAKTILFSLCFQGMLLAPAFGQSASGADSSMNAPVTGPVVAADGRVGYPANGPLITTASYTMPKADSNATDSPNYVLGPEDQITVRVFAAEDIPDRPAQIANDGTVTLPMIGRVHAAGLTVDQLQVTLVADYKKFFKDPQVTVQVNEFRSQPVSVAGNVNTPGVVQLRGNRNLMEVIGQAGGLRADAGDSVLITRNLDQGSIPVGSAFTDPTGKYSVAHINIRDIMSGKNPQGNITIKPHDVITVPRARMVYVLGNVTRPGGYVITENESMSLTQVVALAGGWSGNAALTSARILRANGGAQREQIPANIKKIMKNEAPDLEMRPDDILYVPNSMSKVIAGRAVETAVSVGTGFLIWR